MILLTPSNTTLFYHHQTFMYSYSRAKEERKSRHKAMTERAKRGLLTEEEKLILAEEEAARTQRSMKGDKECLVM